MSAGLNLICVIKDKKANLYSSILTFDTEESACRYFSNIAKKDDNVCDYDLYVIGHYSPSFGEFQSLEHNEKYLLMSGDSFKAQVDERSSIVNLKENIISDLKRVHKILINKVKNAINFGFENSSFNDFKEYEELFDSYDLSHNNLNEEVEKNG